MFVMCLNQTTIKLGVILMTDLNESNDLDRTRPALDLGFHDAKLQYGINFDIVYHNYTEFCSNSPVVGHMSEMFYLEDVKAFIGPVCSGSIVSAGRLAQYLELPLITGQGYTLVRDRNSGNVFETLTKLSFDIGKLSSK